MRNALVPVPAAGAGRRLPVVLAFHGAHGSGEVMSDYSGFSRLADREHFVAVYPTAAGARRFWTLNGGGPKAPEGVGFIPALPRGLPQHAPLGAPPVYATRGPHRGGVPARLGRVLRR